MTMPAAEDASFQARVVEWARACFGDAVAADRLERADRFFEEAAELYQAAAEARRARAATFDPALDGAREKALALEEARRRAHQLVDYTFAREVGHPGQEMGGVLLTAAAFASAYDLDMRAEKTDAIAVLAVNLAMAEERSALLLDQERKRRREMERRVALLERIIDEEGLVVDGDPVPVGYAEQASPLHAPPVVCTGAPAP